MQRLFVFISVIALILAGCSVPTPVAVNLSAPADGSTVASVTPVLSWTGGTADTNYRLAVASDVNFQGLVIDAPNLSIVNYTVPSGKLVASTQYYWRVQPSKGGHAADWTVARSFKTPGATPAVSGNIRVSATLDGAAWNGPVNFRISGPHTDTENTVPWSFNGITAGSYTITYNFGGPQGATLSNITPSPTIELAAGSTGYFTLNFNTTSSSRITVSATLDGVAWSGEINYSIYGAYKDIDTYVPHTFISIPTGAYTVTYNSGGPQGAVYNGISPAPSQSLTAGGEIEFKLNFIRSKSSTLSITALNNGSPWAGSVQYSISGPIAGSYSSVPIVFSDVPSGTYTVSYQSGGPSGSTMGSITPAATLIVGNGRPAEFTFNYYAQPQSGNVVVNATLNGASWSGPVNFAVSGPLQSSDYQVPRRYTPAPPGYYTVSYQGGGPAGATLSSITPAPSQKLAAGQTITFTLNFFSQPSTGTIIISATLDGRPWMTNPGSGPISYSVFKPGLADTGDTVPATLRDYPTGPYTLVYNSGGPIGATLTGISPSPNQFLSVGGTIAFTMNFTSEARGHITVDATLDGQAWSGPVNYIVMGPYVESGNSVSMTFSNCPKGTYNVQYRSGGPDIGRFAGVTPSTQELSPGGSIAFTIIFTNTMPGPIRPVPSPMPGPVPHPTPGPMPGPVPNPTPEPMPGPVPNPTPVPMPGPVPNPTPEPMPGPVTNTAGGE
jgi:hypothetical protein